MQNNNYFSQEVTVFHGNTVPEIGKLAGYAAIIAAVGLPVTLPDKLL